MNYDDLVRRLRDYIGAYPEDLFPPLTMEEKQETTKLPGLFARGCAQMGRRFEKEAKEAADAIQELQRDAERWRFCIKEGFPRLLADKDRMLWIAGRDSEVVQQHGTTATEAVDAAIDKAMEQSHE